MHLLSWKVGGISRNSLLPGIEEVLVKWTSGEELFLWLVCDGIECNLTPRARPSTWVHVQVTHARAPTWSRNFLLFLIPFQRNVCRVTGLRGPTRAFTWKGNVHTSFQGDSKPSKAESTVLCSSGVECRTDSETLKWLMTTRETVPFKRHSHPPQHFSRPSFELILEDQTPTPKRLVSIHIMVRTY